MNMKTHNIFTLSKEDYEGLEKDLAEHEFVIAFIKDRINRELDKDCRNMLKVALEYFESGAESRRIELRNFTPVF